LIAHAGHARAVFAVGADSHDLTALVLTLRNVFFVISSAACAWVMPNCSSIALNSFLVNNSFLNLFHFF